MKSLSLVVMILKMVELEGIELNKSLPYLSLILVALLTLKDDPNNGQKIVTGILIGWAVVAAWCISGFQFKPSDWRMEIREELDLRPLYWKKAIEVYYAVVIAVAVVAGIVMPNV